MKAFLARWPNGDVSLVVAKSKEDACVALDEIDDPFDVNIIPIEPKSRLAVHFKLLDDGEMEYESSSEDLSNQFSKAWPILEAERGKLIEANIEESNPAWNERMREAVKKERQREYGCNAEDAASRAFGYSPEGDEGNKEA